MKEEELSRGASLLLSLLRYSLSAITVAFWLWVCGLNFDVPEVKFAAIISYILIAKE